jgi:hypothetical protein
MIRILIWNIFLFCLPFLLTMMWSRWLKRTHPPETRIRSLAWSGLIGALLVMASLISYRFVDGEAPQGDYVPPDYKDGTLTPGHFK